MPFRSPRRKATTPGGEGRFEGFDVLSQVDHWDDVTAGVVLARLDPGKELSFFTPPEQACAGALFDLILDQCTDPKVPVLALVDRRLALGETDGWRYEDMAEDGDAWRFTLARLDHDAHVAHGERFHALEISAQADLVQGVHDAKIWHGIDASHVWSLWTRYACAAYYSHPWAWNEIGFGGPAYPRGYKAIGIGRREPWEVADGSNADPVPWAERIEAARRSHQDLAGPGEDA